ncbi:Alpha/Beta hydrolase protein [Halenospora varia]|nr:Alpha/Beta hydrolase protein [Halenospora varia]
MERREYTFKVVDDVSIAADVYWSSQDNSNAKCPIAVHFHGGSFVIGSKRMLQKAQIEKLLELGFVVVSANYRLCPTISLYDGPVTDSLDAFKWAQTELPSLLKKDAKVEVDGTRAVALGHSCGGALALLTASLPNPPLAILDMYGMKYLKDPAYNTPSPAPPNAQPLDPSFINQVYKDTSPPTNGPPPMGPNGPDFSNYRVAWMFNTIGAGKLMQTIVTDGNFDRIDPASLFSKGKFPPTYFIHGTADTLVDQEFSQRAHNEVKSHGSESHLVLIEGAGHGFDAAAQPGDDKFAVICRGFEFLRNHV